jgi:hypothetical protein
VVKQVKKSCPQKQALFLLKLVNPLFWHEQSFSGAINPIAKFIRIFQVACCTMRSDLLQIFLCPYPNADEPTAVGRNLIGTAKQEYHNDRICKRLKKRLYRPTPRAVDCSF